MLYKKLLSLLSGTALAVMAVVGIGNMTALGAGPNLVPNPSMETLTGSTPASWSNGKWGTNTATFNYLSSGCQNGSRCLSVTISGYASGDAKWHFNPIAVSPNTAYTFSGWYQSGVVTEVDAVVTDTAGNTSYIWLGSPAASSSWKQATYTFTTPANAAKVTIYHVLSKNGTLKTDNFSLTASSATPTPTVTPTPTPSPNMIPNPSVETVSGTQPLHWDSSSWGTNTSTFQYLSTGHSGSKSIKATVSGYVDGAANWAYAPQNIAPGSYQFSNWYQSNVETEIDAEVIMNDGSVEYFYIASVLPSTNWKQVKAQFTMPAGAKQVSIFHLIAANGYLITDDYSLATYVPAAFSRGLVSITFDDGWSNQYTNAYPILSKYGLPATFYVVSGELTNQPYYMTGSQVKSLWAAGHEIGSHSVTHSDLTQISSSQLTTEMAQSQSTLQSLIGAAVVTNFAYPLGAYNATTLNVGKNYYKTQRTVESGYNTKDNFDSMRLKVQNIFADTTPAQVKAWLDQASADKSWLILVYHEVANAPVTPDDAYYTTKVADFDAEMSHVKNSGLGVVTVAQAMNEITPQLGN